MFQDALAAELAVVGPKSGATAGAPVQSALELYDDGGTSVGIWEVDRTVRMVYVLVTTSRP